MQNRIDDICLILLHYVFSHVSLRHMHNGMHSHTDCTCLLFSRMGLQVCLHSACIRGCLVCICMTSLHCVLPNRSLNGLTEKMQNHTVCFCMTFLHCESSNDSSNCAPGKLKNHTDCICFILLHRVLPNAFSNCLHLRMHNHSRCRSLTFLRMTSFGIKFDSMEATTKSLYFSQG